MTDEEINRAIAEIRGWKNLAFDVWHNELVGVLPTNKDVRSRIPDFCTDLNAMHEAYSTMTEDKQWEFIKTLVNYQQGSFPLLSRSESLVLAKATARQRAEAFLRTVGKWEEAK